MSTKSVIVILEYELRTGVANYLIIIYLLCFTTTLLTTICLTTTNTDYMNELIYKPEVLPGHPNSGIEEEMRFIVMLVEMGNNEEDIESVYRLKDKILIEKFDETDIQTLIKLKDRYTEG